MCVRERDCAPVPHDLVHVVQAPKVATWQSAGHACALHSRVSAECGQALPPKKGIVVLRERFCMPRPHDFVQGDHASNVSTAQSMGQLCALHERVSAVCGQALPPTVGCTCVRERDCAPVPHDLVHVVQAPKVATWQSTGHA